MSWKERLGSRFKLFAIGRSSLAAKSALCPMSYKSMDEIIAQIGPTADIVERIRPVYNFKASD